MKVTSTDFQQNVGLYQSAALEQPVEITKNGRLHTVLLSAATFKLLLSGRAARPVEELDDASLQALTGNAAMLAASTPGWLKSAWDEAKRRGIDTLTDEDVEAEIAVTRRERSAAGKDV